MRSALVFASLAIGLIATGNVIEAVMWRLYKAGKIEYTTWERRHTPWISGIYVAAGCCIVLSIMRLIVEVT